MAPCLSAAQPNSCPLPDTCHRPRRYPRFRGLARYQSKCPASTNHSNCSTGNIKAVMSSPPNPGSPKIPATQAVKCLPNLEACNGHLVHLPSRAEAQALLSLSDAYVLEVPVRAANDILTAVDQVVEKDKSITLSHLRRFAKADNLPRYLQDRLRLFKSSSVNHEAEEALNTLDFDGPRSESPPRLKVAKEEAPESLFLLIGLTRLVSLQAITPIIRQHNVHNEILRTRVPLSPPMSPNLAREWSDLYWPTQYRKSTPLGPHPTVVRQGTENAFPYSGYWMAQVLNIAQQGSSKGYGLPIGALIVDSKGPSAPAPVAVAADARYGIPNDHKCDIGDNVMNHAVMRAIGLVGRKRMSLIDPPRESPRTEIVLDYPLLETERKVFQGNVLPSGGYLCTGLDIYLTHEPCVMCAQAILHSRFDKVIFRRRMSNTGAATPERPGIDHAGLGYGLFWRPELNWRLLAWEWKDDEKRDDAVPGSMHA